MASTGASIYRMVVVLAVALLAVSVPPHVEAAVTCDQVYAFLFPCLSYLQDGGTVPLLCCPGISGLLSIASTTKDRQTTCGCLKSVVTGAPPLYINRAAGLPDKCGIKVPFKISPSTECSKVQ